MLSIGWTEMMLVAAVALIVVGPRDLPAMLRQIGKAVGSVRKMGNEFKAELNKITAVDEIRDIKRSIAAPLTDTRASIEKEFNSISDTGQVVPSGKIKPADPNAQSVVDEIRAAAGMGTSLEDNGAAAKASISAAVTKATKSQAETVEGAETTAPKPKRARTKPKAGGTKAGGTKSAKPKSKPTAAKKPAVAAKSAVAKERSTARKPATAKRAAAKKPAAKKPAAASKSTNSKTSGTKPAVRKSAARKAAPRKATPRKATPRKDSAAKTSPAQAGKAE